MPRALALCALALAVSTTAGAAPPVALRVPFEKYTLPSGLTVILHEDHRVPTVTIDLWYRVGSRDERPGRTGFAHLFEHLMFMGTRRVPSGELDRMMESAGGQSNATTSEDRTSYFETGPRELLETFLYLEADRMASLGDDITSDKLDAQRKIVENERHETVDNRPYGRVEAALPEHLFPPDHPYHHSVLGSLADLRAATVSDVRDFFRTWYVPANAQLVVAGDFQTDEARRLVERWFGWMPRLPAPSRGAVPPPPALEKSQTVTLEEPVEAAQIAFAMPSPPSFSPGDAECELLAAALGTGRSSRLHHALVHERKIAQSVEAEQHAGRLASYFVVTVTAQKGHDAAELEKALEEELARLATSPPTAAELSRARALVTTERLRHLERAQSMADELNLFEFNFGDPGAVERRLIARYDAVKVEDLARVAGQVIVGRPRVTVRVVPASAPRPEETAN